MQILHYILIFLNTPSKIHTPYEEVNTLSNAIPNKKITTIENKSLINANTP